ncbi:MULTISPECIES: GIY-YIG nuclease family protein [Aequorivita]|uniref:GIY-YIG nuclease family protein n=2 Tax=Aequorivita TaxID=153265 RepID=A0ABY8KUV1_9FLAO|nr:GIY-YIG nuclease family protein [Aequorivita sp. Ant34-E75]WGF92836.1 GIY-YIG nuclease family protein [Aequorivita sp. Ant34-E75]WGF92837.1 GIY-YIG nuclease family protein [Aequorivita sp. Ant34-E75]
MFYIYVLYSVKFDRMYVGMTINCEHRLRQHNSGKTQSTKAFMPWIIIHKEEYLTREEARDRERYLKSAAGRRWRRKHLNLAAWRN